MVIRWVNNYHSGFNRLWLVLSCLVTFAFVGFNALMDEYKVSKPESVRYWLRYGTGEEMIKQRVLERWWEWHVKEEGNPQKDKKPGLSQSDIKQIVLRSNVKARILTDVQSMKEAKYFKKDELEKLIDKVIKKEQKYQDWVKAYPQRVWKARGRFVRDLLGAFIMTFAFGHSVFLVVYWIIKGFRKG